MERHPVPMSRLLRVARGHKRPPAKKRPAPAAPARLRRLSLLGLVPLAWVAVVCTRVARPRVEQEDDGPA